MKYALHFIYQIVYNYSSKTEVTAGMPITNFTTVEEQRENFQWDTVLVLSNRHPENFTGDEQPSPAIPIRLTCTHSKVVDLFECANAR